MKNRIQEQLKRYSHNKKHVQYSNNMMKEESSLEA